MSQKSLAQLVSFIFMPAFVFVAGILVLGTSGLSDLASAVVFLTVGGVPMFLLEAMLYLRKVRVSMDLPQPLRDWIYFTGFVGFTIASVVFGSQFRSAINWYNLSLVTAVFWGLYFVINRYFDKLSAHVGTFVFVSTLLAGKLNMAYSLLLLFVPLIIWARIELRKHEWIDIWWGLAVGLGIGLLSWLI